MILFIIPIICLLSIRILGKEQICFCIKNLFYRLCGFNQPNMSLGLSYIEANDFRKILQEFFKPITLSGYAIDNIGALEIIYDICIAQDVDMLFLKRAILLELHNYLLVNHGIDTWNYYVHTLTEHHLVLHIALSPMAQEQFLKLNFSPPETIETPVMSDD